MNTLPFATALVAGLAHALEADHLAAVTTFVSRRPHPLRALRFGIGWGIGHTAALLVAGGALVLLQIELPARLVIALEAGVGAMLVGLGCWTLVGVARRDTGDHQSALDAGPGSSGACGPQGSASGATWVGAAHGLAGTAGFLAIVPAMLLASPWAAGGYLLVFGVGTVGAMGAYALLAGLLFHRAGEHASAMNGTLRCFAGAASIGVGLVWMHGVLG
jgi:hypothetical protein